MAARGDWKVYRGEEYVASFKYPEDAAAFVSVVGKAGTIRYYHNWVVWREGLEAFSAYDSYDQAAAVCKERVIDRQKGRGR